MRFKLSVTNPEALDDLGALCTITEWTTTGVMPRVHPNHHFERLPGKTGGPSFIAEFWQDGINHRVENGLLVRDHFHRKVEWHIKIETLEQLIKVANRMDAAMVIDSDEIREDTY